MLLKMFCVLFWINPTPLQLENDVPFSEYCCILGSINRHSFSTLPVEWHKYRSNVPFPWVHCLKCIQYWCTNLLWDTGTPHSLKPTVAHIAKRTGLPSSFMTFDDAVVECHTENWKTLLVLLSANSLLFNFFFFIFVPLRYHYCCNGLGF